MKASIYIILIFVLAGCLDQDEYYNISSDKKPVFFEGDVLIYKSSHNEYDTLVILDRIDDYDVSDKRYFHEWIRLRLKNNRNSEEGIQVYYNSFSLSWKGAHMVLRDLNEQHSTNIVVDNTQFDVFPVLPDFYYLNTEDSVQKVFYNHKYCVVRYECISGKVWELDNLQEFIQNE